MIYNVEKSQYTSRHESFPLTHHSNVRDILLMILGIYDAQLSIDRPRKVIYGTVIMDSWFIFRQQNRMF